MREFFRGTWLPTSLFMAATLPLYLSNRECGLAPALGPALTAAILVPVTWRWYVIQSGPPQVGRAALAGASLAYVIVTLSNVIDGVRFSLTHSWGQLELGAIASGLMDLVMILGGLLIGAPVGALLGVVAAWVQRACWKTHLSSCPSTVATVSPSTLKAVMIMILLSPVLAFIALAIAQEALATLSSKYAIGYAFGLAATWAVAIPIAAILGSRGATITRSHRGPGQQH